MCQCDPVIRLTPEAKRLVCILKTLFFIYVMLIFLEIVFGNYNEAFSGIMIVLLLLMTFMQCYFLMAGYLIFLAAFSAFYALIFIGQRAQNKIAGLPDRFLIHGFYIAVLVLECLMFIYYIILIYYSFQAYKEFKACLLGVGGGYSKEIIKYNHTITNIF